MRQLIRLLRSDKFHELTPDHIRTVGEYRSIELDGEPFFDRAFSSGKEAAGSLGFAKLMGRSIVLDDLIRLGLALGCGRPGEGDPT